MTLQRARNDHAKLGRRRQLLDAAAARFDAAGYAATTMAEVATAAGLAKGTTYLYFRSKEALFLELLLEELGAWVEVAAAEVGEPGKSEKAEKEEAAENVKEAEEAGQAEKVREAEKRGKAEKGRTGAVAAALAESLAARPRLVRLLALRAPVLAPGVGADAVHRCSARQLDLVEPLAGRLAATIPGLGAGGARAAIDLLLALAAGFADRLESLDTLGEEIAGEPQRANLDRAFLAAVSPSMELLLLSKARPPAATPPAP